VTHLSTIPPPPSSRLELVVNTGRKSEVFPVDGVSVVGIGRDVENTIRVDDPSVSRQHLKLHPAGDMVEVEDLGSANGTLLVRGAVDMDEEETGPGTAHRLPPHQRLPMRVGDMLRVGPAVISLQSRRRSSQSQLRGKGISARSKVLVDPEMKNAHELVTRAASSDVSVLILGETGVGKELMAETVHQQSRRASRPFLLLNCAALPESLLESELFGHEKGAFTGAHQSKVGLLESTDGGTVFLDEIGELGLGTQAKLLRVLEERTLLRVGGTKARRIDVRFVTATNRDLAREARAGRFRNDLYYRISGLVVRIPPLRKRPTEIEPFARHFLREFSRHLGQPEPFLSPGAIAALTGYSWPGNVRELKNVIERAVLIATDGVIARDHVLLDPDELESDDVLVAPDAPTQVFERPKEESGDVSQDERQRLIRALEECGGNQTRAAKQLGISRRTLINRIEQWQLPRPKKR
jgi:two-component system, NtrC family, response regulator AtoC